MESVAIDIFAMPEVTLDGQIYNQFALCVDRLSGWMVAIPCSTPGWTADKIAKEMHKFWELFGIPSVISSDKGPHFISGWWEALCSAHGVRKAYAQPYHHRASGKVESTGNRLREKIKKLLTDVEEPLVCWVELLPKAVRFLHDTPGPSGLTPYEIVTGRNTTPGGYPLQASFEGL